MRQLYSRYAFDPTSLPFDLAEMCYLELGKGAKGYDIVLEHIALNSVEDGEAVKTAASFAEPQFAAADDDDDDEEDCSSCAGKGKSNGAVLKAGLGLFAFRDNSGQLIYALHQSVGDPVGTSCGVSQHYNLVLFTRGEVQVISSFIKSLIDSSEKTKSLYYKMFKWNSRHEYWRRAGSCKARTMESVVLPASVKAKVVDDISRFLLPETKAFYDQHGIPYRRSFLLYGVPGAGKTSLIQALAGHFKRNVSFLQLTDDDMSDSSLLSSIANLTRNTIVVMEDIDSCFAKDRSNKISHSKVTFSGLLNALDGVGSSHGQIFILTTNLRENLDPALIRCGRVDVQIEFTHAVDEQKLQMWRSFYPQAEHMAEDFLATLNHILAGRNINTASLQHFFVLNMHSSPDEALASIGRILEDMEFVEKVKADEEAEKLRLQLEKEAKKKEKDSSAEEE